MKKAIIRDILRQKCSLSQKKKYLVNVGHMEEAVPSLMDVVGKKQFGF